MIKISKELLSEVLDCSIDNYTIAKSTEITQIRVWKKDTDMWDYRSYDIHHLAHKCKEWALAKGYIINSGATTNNDWCSTIYKVIQENPYIEELSHTWGQLEVEAIFKACEWILDNKPL